MLTSKNNKWAHLNNKCKGLWSRVSSTTSKLTNQITCMWSDVEHVDQLNQQFLLSIETYLPLSMTCIFSYATYHLVLFLGWVHCLFRSYHLLVIHIQNFIQIVIFLIVIGFSILGLFFQQHIVYDQHRSKQTKTTLRISLVKFIFKTTFKNSNALANDNIVDAVSLWAEGQPVKYYKAQQKLNFTFNQPLPLHKTHSYKNFNDLKF